MSIRFKMALILGLSASLASAVQTGDDDSLRQAPRQLKAREHGVGRLVPDLAMTDVNGRAVRLTVPPAGFVIYA